MTTEPKQPEKAQEPAKKAETRDDWLNAAAYVAQVRQAKKKLPTPMTREYVMKGIPAPLGGEGGAVDREQWYLGKPGDDYTAAYDSVLGKICNGTDDIAALMRNAYKGPLTAKPEKKGKGKQ